MEVEQEALQLGWIPQDQFRGDPAKWTDAETFVTRGKEILPILRKNNEKLQGTVEHLGQEVTTLKGALATANEAMGEFRRYHEETAKRAYDSAVRDLRAQKLVALEDGDQNLLAIAGGLGGIKSASQPGGGRADADHGEC